MVLDYTEELTACSHRHPAVITLRTAVDADGKLCALHARAVFSGGGYAALKANAEVTVQGPRRVASYYRIPAIQVETICAYTNQVPCTQTRTPGSPQTTFAMESQIDIIARELGMDPVAFRMKNLLNDGDATPFGQKLKGIVVKETLKKALDVSGWKKPKVKNIGRGVAVYERPSGAGRSGAAITFESDGSVTVNLGVPDVGPGIHTVVQQIVGEMLDLPRERVNIRVADTDSSPYDSGTGGSKSTNSVGTAAYQAVSEVKEKFVALAAARLGCKPEDLQEVKGRYTAPGQKALAFADLMRLAVEQNHGVITHLSVYEPARAAITSFAAQVAEVEVDPGTGQVKVKKLTTVHDSGTVLNHLSYTRTNRRRRRHRPRLRAHGRQLAGRRQDVYRQPRRVQNADGDGRAEVNDRVNGRRHRPNSVSRQGDRGNSQRPNSGRHRQCDPRRRRRAALRSADYGGEGVRSA